jgi:5'-nucleotidase
MHILITNDDGILAPGIRVLAKYLEPLAKISVIAPDRNMSGISSAISLETPLRVMEQKPNWYQLNGTPADCVKLALSGFLSEEPDIVISGINAGPNLGDDVVYSGTVAAAIEGRFLRYPSIAVSCGSHAAEMNYDTAAQVVVKLFKHIQRKQLKSGLILNVNVPNISIEELKGIQVTRQGTRHFSEPLKLTEDGRGKPIYWLGEAGPISDGSPGTDFHAMQENYASVTPLQIDMTAHQDMNVITDWLQSSA